MQKAVDCQLYAVVEADPGAADRLSAALGAANIPSCLIAPVAGSILHAAEVTPLVNLAQHRGVAALILNDPLLAGALRADGTHLAARKDLAVAYAEARATLGRDAAIGVDVGISRHDAMALAEAGADYVAFGAPAYLQDRGKARIRRNDLIGWWAEIFEVPCVALDVETAQEAETLATIGADFLAIRLAAGQSPARAGELFAEIAATLRATSTD
jgi:thiamine-phosphate pyrophosphorylase